MRFCHLQCFRTKKTGVQIFLFAFLKCLSSSWVSLVSSRLVSYHTVSYRVVVNKDNYRRKSTRQRFRDFLWNKKVFSLLKGFLEEGSNFFLAVSEKSRNKASETGFRDKSESGKDPKTIRKNRAGTGRYPIQMMVRLLFYNSLV